MWCRIDLESIPASICMMVTPVCFKPLMIDHSIGARPAAREERRVEVHHPPRRDGEQLGFEDARMPRRRRRRA
jgi:hypothetical protein